MAKSLKEQVGSELAALQTALHQMRQDNTALQVLLAWQPGCEHALTQCSLQCLLGADNCRTACL